MTLEEKCKQYVEFVRKLSEEPSTGFNLSETESVSPGLMHASAGLITEAAEILDEIKKHLAYKRPLDKQKLREELGDLLFYWTLAIDECELDIEELIKMNMIKLTARYPEGYSNARANNRDEDVERRAVEDNHLGGQNENI